MENLKKNKKRDWAPIMFVVSLILSLIFAITSVLIPFGPGTFLLELQYSWFDGYYYTKLTILILWIISLLSVTFSGAILYFFGEYIYKKIKK